MVTTKPVKVDEEVKTILDEKKEYPRETYNDVLRKILGLKPKIKDKQQDENTTSV